jgi:hypothetical protein
MEPLAVLSHACGTHDKQVAVLVTVHLHNRDATKNKGEHLEAIKPYIIHPP